MKDKPTAEPAPMRPGYPTMNSQYDVIAAAFARRSRRTDDSYLRGSCRFQARCLPGRSSRRPLGCVIRRWTKRFDWPQEWPPTVPGSAESYRLINQSVHARQVSPSLRWRTKRGLQGDPNPNSEGREQGSSRGAQCSRTETPTLAENRGSLPWEKPCLADPLGRTFFAWFSRERLAPRVVAESGAIIVDYIVRRHGHGRLQPDPAGPAYDDYVYWLQLRRGFSGHSLRD
jgi:hypothetical protein